LTTDIDLWLWPLDQPGLAPDLSPLLSDDEQARADRFVRPRDADRYVVGRGQLRHILSGYTDTPAARLVFAYGPQGKPILPGGPVFNLSHSDGWAALAVAPDVPPDFQLGIDIEAQRRVEDGVAARFFSGDEYARLSALPATDWMAGFYRCWTRKEAVIKAVGSGLSTPLDSFDVTLAPGDAAQITRTSGDLAPAAEWSLAHLDLAPGFVGAVAAVTGGGGIRLTVRQGSLPLR